MSSLVPPGKTHIYCRKQNYRLVSKIVAKTLVEVKSSQASSAEICYASFACHAINVNGDLIWCSKCCSGLMIGGCVILLKNLCLEELASNWIGKKLELLEKGLHPYRIRVVQWRERSEKSTSLTSALGMAVGADSKNLKTRAVGTMNYTFLIGKTLRGTEILELNLCPGRTIDLLLCRLIISLCVDIGLKFL